MKPIAPTAVLILALIVSACGAEEPQSNNATSPTNNGTSGDTTNTVAGDSNNGTVVAETLCSKRDEFVDLDEILRELLADANWVHSNSHGQERGFALSLPATDGGHLGVASAFMPCTGAVDFDPFCEPDIDSGLTKCLRIGCVDASTAYAEGYFTDGAMDPAELMPLEYTSADGTETNWPVRPIRRWTEVDDGAVTVSATIDESFTITRGQSIDYSHSGTVVVQGADANGVIDLEFPHLFSDGTTTSVHIEHGVDLIGTIEHGSETVNIGELGIEWSGCE